MLNIPIYALITTTKIFQEHGFHKLLLTVGELLLFNPTSDVFEQGLNLALTLRYYLDWFA